MFDIKWIRDNPEAFDAGLGKRGLAPLAAQMIALDSNRRAAQTTLQDLQRKRHFAIECIPIPRGAAALADGAPTAAQLCGSVLFIILVYKRCL